MSLIRRGRRTIERGGGRLIWSWEGAIRPIMLKREKKGLETRVQRLLTCSFCAWPLPQTYKVADDGGASNFALRHGFCC
jgi:hypothetical protein